MTRVQASYDQYNINLFEHSSSYKIGEYLGKGGEGKVYSCALKYNKSNIFNYVVKILDINQLLKDGWGIHLKNSFGVNSFLCKYKHKNIVNIVDIITVTNIYGHTIRYIIMERYDINLLEYTKNNKINESQIKKIFYQICDGLKFLHNNNIVNRDIKSENILLKLDKNNCISNIVLCDFSLSKILKSKNELMTRECGTLSYISPQVLFRQPYTLKCDIWSLGIVLYELLIGNLPYPKDVLHDPLLLEKAIRTTKITFCSSNIISEDLQLLCKSLLQINPSHRPSLDKILTNKWLSDSNNSNNTNDLKNDTSSSFGLSCQIIRKLSSGYTIITSPNGIRFRFKSIDTCNSSSMGDIGSNRTFFVVENT